LREVLAAPGHVLSSGRSPDHVPPTGVRGNSRLPND
jgi:hypothetical protein